LDLARGKREVADMDAIQVGDGVFIPSKDQWGGLSESVRGFSLGSLQSFLDFTPILEL